MQYRQRSRSIMTASFFDINYRNAEAARQSQKGEKCWRVENQLLK